MYIIYIIPLALQVEETEVKGEMTSLSSVLTHFGQNQFFHLFICKSDNNESDYVTYFGGRVLRFLIWIDRVYWNQKTNLKCPFPADLKIVSTAIYVFYNQETWSIHFTNETLALYTDIKYNW